ncbi:MAG: DUF433 domain-containing protein [Cyanothece sp. SIO1E1]|nr:DUF433 domain-containing protein [Cyanothece sp. SIO1E1]
MADVYVMPDLRDAPTYPVFEAAHYLSIPVVTLRAWIFGRSYSAKVGKQFSEPLIELPDANIKQLSFTNLVEAHVLRGIRSTHHIPLEKVRVALDYVKRQFHTSHPLARIEFQTDGADLFIESVGRLINTSQSGQLLMRATFNSLLKRIELDEAGLAAKLFPFTRANEEDAPKTVVIDPRISFGRPVLVATEVPTAVLAERYQAGQSIDELAQEYDCDRLLIEEAIRCEFQWWREHTKKRE